MQHGRQSNNSFPVHHNHHLNRCYYQPSKGYASHSLFYYLKLIAIVISFLFIETAYCGSLGLIDRSDESIVAQIKDLNSKIEASEKVLEKLLQNKDIQASSDLKEHVEKILDYLRFRKDGINTWKINYRQFETMRDGINKDYTALPLKIVHILSQASKNKIIHIVPYN